VYFANTERRPRVKSVFGKQKIVQKRGEEEGITTRGFLTKRARDDRKLPDRYTRKE